MTSTLSVTLLKSLPKSIAFSHQRTWLSGKEMSLKKTAFAVVFIKIAYVPRKTFIFA